MSRRTWSWLLPQNEQWYCPRVPRVVAMSVLGWGVTTAALLGSERLAGAALASAAAPPAEPITPTDAATTWNILRRVGMALMVCRLQAVASASRSILRQAGLSIEQLRDLL
jgi:hypothetical protein